jgi:hypothetical protein
MKKTVTIPKLKAKLQVVFNSYIRERDKGKPCISCGQIGTLQAGHFYPVKNYDGLRFNELNTHGECPKCNLFDEMHLLSYAANLIDRIGEHEFNELKYSAHIYKMDGYKYSRTELEEMIKEYSEKLKQLRA